VSKVGSSADVLATLRGQDLRLRPPYWVPAHLSVDGRFVSWVHSDPGLAKPGEGFRFDVPDGGDTASILAAILQPAPNDVYAVLVGTELTRIRHAAELCHREFGIETAIALLPPSTIAVHNAWEFVSVEVTR
jgi:hypothetical protein